MYYISSLFSLEIRHNLRPCFLDYFSVYMLVNKWLYVQFICSMMQLYSKHSYCKKNCCNIPDNTHVYILVHSGVHLYIHIYIWIHKCTPVCISMGIVRYIYIDTRQYTWVYTSIQYSYTLSNMLDLYIYNISCAVKLLIIIKTRHYRCMYALSRAEQLIDLTTVIEK